MFTIPTYNHNNGSWTHTEFSSRKEFSDFIGSIIKEPGEYEFDEITSQFNLQARNFNKNGHYCESAELSKDFKDYWNDEKDKCTNGVIYEHNGKQWYLTKDYYMWLNFLPIYHKDIRDYKFPSIWDSQYHTFLVEYHAELEYKHIVLLKKRQWGASFLHASKLINSIWFDKGVTLKLISYLDKYINMEGTWSFITEYRDFLNANTGWYRNFEPDKVGNWQQKIKVTENGRETYKGLKGRLLNVTTKASPTSGVGGASRYCIVEEMGINPTADITYEYIRPALQLGGITTGQFIGYGSVGDLDQCEPLKKYMLNPEMNGFYGIKTKFFDDKGTEEVAGLFIPEQWSMPPFIDKYGNSLVNEALEFIHEERKRWEKELEPQDYQLRVSQKPTNILEAFNTRSVSLFPKHLVQMQKNKIENKEYPFEKVELKRDLKTGEIKPIPSNIEPIWEFPISKKAKDKRGCLIIYKRPDKNPEWGTYYASIDPVSQGNTKESDSLCSIMVWKNETEITKPDESGELMTYIEEGELVAEWTGRYDDINDTHEQLRIIIEYYNAWTLLEANLPQFITHMTNKKKLHYLVPSEQMIFNREIGSKIKPNYPYGWKNTGRIFKETILPYLLNYISEVIGHRTNPDTGKEIPVYGIEKIPSLMVMKEMEAYKEGLNVDRLIALASLIAFVTVQKAHRSILRKTINVNENLENSKKNHILNKRPNPFSSTFSRGGSGIKFKKSAFKSLR